MPQSLETKSAVEDILKAFEDFKKSNDERIEQIEKKGFADPLLNEAVDKNNEHISRLEKKLRDIELELIKKNRIVNGSTSDLSEDKLEHKNAFDAFVRKGLNQNLTELEKKAYSSITGGDGGYLVPENIDTQITALLKAVSPIRSMARVVPTGTDNYKKRVDLGGMAAGWVGKGASRSATSTGSFALLSAYMGELYANPGVEQSLLDDSAVDLESYLAQEIGLKFAQMEAESGFVAGDGVDCPKGFLSYTTAATADASRTFGVIEHVATGVSGDWAASGKTDVLITLTEKFKQGMLVGAQWAMSGSTIGAIRKLKDGNGIYYWNPDQLVNGGGANLLGYPVRQFDDMPAIGAGSLSIALANWQRAYTIVDRMGVRILRDPYTNKPFVHFYATKRVGGFVEDSEAIKFIKFASS
jgi:HK97 family phage major capsid protein